MAYFERMRDVISSPFSAGVIQQRTAAGWQMVSIEWRRELPESEAPVEGAFAVLEVTRWPESGAGAAGTVTEILGDPGDVRARIDSILRNHGIDEKFPDEVKAEAESFGERLEPDMWKGREELFDLHRRRRRERLRRRGLAGKHVRRHAAPGRAHSRRRQLRKSRHRAGRGSLQKGHQRLPAGPRGPDAAACAVGQPLQPGAAPGAADAFGFHGRQSRW